MPFTPFHVGPGLAIKAVAGRKFSIITFGVAQIVMDIEPLVAMILGSDILHGETHTYLAALPLGLLTAIISIFFYKVVIRKWNKELVYYRFESLIEPEKLSLPVAIASALLGTFSHIVFDSMMHIDIRPLSPFSDANSLCDVVSTEHLYQFCLFSGIFGALGWFFTIWRKMKAMSPKRATSSAEKAAPEPPHAKR